MIAAIGAACLLLSATPLSAADQMNIWPDDSPELKGVAAKDIPKLTLYPALSTTGKKPAVLICPAGGYKFHSESSGHAKWLNSLGISAYVVSYRLPGNGYKHPAPLRDAQRAMRTIRQNAERWGLDGARIGVWGGSSGGHVATTLSTHFDNGDKASADPVEQQACRPDFALIFDAVITMQGKACHGASRARLLPENPSQQLVDNLSNELQVTANTPPTFVFAGGQDGLVPAENSMLYLIALRNQGVAFSELHFTSHGGHGFTSPESHALAEEWMRRLAILPVKEGEKPWPGQFEKGAWKREPTAFEANPKSPAPTGVPVKP
jgi:acetyl esterase/lipase